MQYATTPFGVTIGEPPSLAVWIREGRPQGAHYATGPQGAVRVAPSAPVAPRPSSNGFHAGVELDVAMRATNREEKFALVRDIGQTLGSQWRGDAEAYARSEGFDVVTLSRAEMKSRFGGDMVGLTHVGRRTMYVASELDSIERTLTVGHELAHHFLKSVCSGEKSDKELLCEAFAKSFWAGA
jgi:hypothetical protein